jgi:hypothetical protein
MNEDAPDHSLAERIAEAVKGYYRQADSVPLSARELLAWYGSLSPQDQAHVHTLGPYHWAVLPLFKRYVLEQRGHSLAAYMQRHLTPPEFDYWLAQQDAPN